MRFSLVAATLAFAVSGSAALAWGDMYMGDGTNNPNSNMLVHAYKAPNLCPAGLQPVTVGGVICCGNPNAGYYIDRPGGQKKYYKARHKPAPRAYAPAGEKGVVYR
ncbi:hypothetical protein JYP51_13885 [Ponticoccus gilvus]|nr:hypothetical protein [Enemella evansiae]